MDIQQDFGTSKASAHPKPEVQRIQQLIMSTKSREENPQQESTTFNGSIFR
jgi:hypothetical protein